MPGKCKHMGMYTSTATNFLIREMVKFESQKDSAISAGLNVIVFCLFGPFFVFFEVPTFFLNCWIVYFAGLLLNF